MHPNDEEALSRTLGLAREYTEFSIVLTTADLDVPGPTIVFVNDVFSRMTGYSLAEAVGQSPRFLQGPDTDRKVLDQLKADLTAGRPFVGRAVNYHKSGEPFLLEWTISPVAGLDGKPSHYIAMQRDISRQSFAEWELRQRDEELLRLYQILKDVAESA